MKDKKIKLSNKQILENLKLLKYNKEKHSSLHHAVQDFLCDKKYANIMNGVITDGNSLREVQVMLEAFRNLKEYEKEIISGDFFNENLEFNEEELGQFVINTSTDGKCRILKKSLTEKKYDCIFESELHSYIGIYFKDNKVCNFQGKIIFEEEFQEIEQITSRILRIDNYYLTIDGNITVPITKVIDKIIKSDSLTADQKYEFLVCFTTERSLPYLEEEILSINDGFICSEIDGCISYYKLNGAKVISNDQDGYCYIDKSFETKEDYRHIVSVAKLDCSLNKVFGYYDLDNNRELCSPQFIKTFPWVGYGAVALTKEYVCFVNEDGKVLDCEISLDKQNLFPVLIKKFKHEFKERGMDAFIKDLINEESFSANYYILTNLSKITEDLYIAQYGSDKEIYPDNKPMLIDTLLKNPKANPTIISGLYQNISLRSKDKKSFFVKTFDKTCCELHKDYEWKILSFEGKETQFTFNNNDVTGCEKHYSLDVSLKNSLFLEDTYKEAIRLIEQKDNQDISTINVMPTFNQLTLLHQNYLSTIPKISFQSNSISPLTKVHSISNINEMGSAKLLLKVGFDYYDCLYSDSDNYFVYGKDISFKKLDNCNHILLGINYNESSSPTGEREMLVDKSGNLLIGLSKKITLEDKYYIVTRCDNKKQIFDKNAIPLTLPSDDIKFVDKLYIDKNGFIRKQEKKLVVINFGYEYLLDDDQDYLIDKQEEYNDIFEDIKKLTLQKI